MRSSEAQNYIIAVAEGREQYDPGRYKAAEFICNKLIPNPPQATVEVDQASIPDFNVIYSD